MIVKYKYPEDPEMDAELMFGAEFVARHRPGGLGLIQVNDNPPITFREIICDGCSALIGDYSPCMLIGNWLYCWDCVTSGKKLTHIRSIVSA